MKVLIVDDEDLIRNIIKDYCINEGYSTYEASDGIEAIDVFKKNADIDIIVLDIMMPNMNGVEVLKKLREEKVNVPVIALTADAIEGQEEKYISEGFDGYLSKPIDKTKLKVILNKYLKGE